jgi:hypothetical protein
MTDQAPKAKSKTLRIVALVIVVLLGTCAYLLRQRIQYLEYFERQEERTRIAIGVPLEKAHIKLWLQMASSESVERERAKLSNYIEALSKVQEIQRKIAPLREAIEEEQSGLKNKDHLQEQLLILEAEFDDAWATVQRMRKDQDDDMSEFFRPTTEQLEARLKN